MQHQGRTNRAGTPVWMAVIAAVLFLAQSSLPAVLCDGFEASAKDGAHAPADAKALVSAHARGAGGPVAARPDPDARVSVSFDCAGAWSARHPYKP